MFFDDKRKNIGAAIMGTVTPHGEVHDSYEHDNACKMIAEDMMHAIHAKDVEGLHQALLALVAYVQTADEEQDRRAMA